MRHPHKMIKHTQTLRRQKPTNCLSVFDHFVGLAYKGLGRHTSLVTQELFQFLGPLLLLNCYSTYQILKVFPNTDIYPLQLQKDILNSEEDVPVSHCNNRVSDPKDTLKNLSRKSDCNRVTGCSIVKAEFSLYIAQQIGISMDETITEKDLDDLLWVFSTGSKAVSWCFYSVKHSMIYIFL